MTWFAKSMKRAGATVIPLRNTGRAMVAIEPLERRQLLSAAVAGVELGASQGITAGATDLGEMHLRSTHKTVGSVGLSSADTVYQIEVTASINLGLTLSQLKQDDQVRILYADGTAVTPGWQNIRTSTLKISQRLDPATYFVDVRHGFIADNTAVLGAGAAHSKVVPVKKYHLKSTNGYVLQLKGLKPDNSIAPQEPAAPMTFGAAFSLGGASAEPTISVALASSSNFNHYQSFTTGYQLWGANGPSPDDVRQQALGDCYFMSVISTLARTDPGLIEQSIVPQNNGEYLVKFQQNGQEVDEEVDPSFPVNSSGTPIFAGIPSDNNIWVPILEKAWCFFRPSSTAPGSYNGIEEGYPSESMKAFGSTDANETEIIHFNTGAQLLNTISTELQQGQTVDVGTNSPPSWPEFKPLSSGLFIGHAYSVVKDDPANNSIELRNPWATSTAGVIDGTGGYITLNGDQLLQSLNDISQGTVPVVTPNTVVTPTPNPTPTPTPTPTPVPNPTNNINTQVVQEQLGPKSFQFTSDNTNYDLFRLTANSTGQAEVSVNSDAFQPQLVVAEVNADGTFTAMGSDDNANGSSTGDVKFSATAGVTYEIGVAAGGDSDTGAYALTLIGDLAAPTQLTPSSTTGSLSGIVFNDANSDGSQNNGEIGAAGVTVYIDLGNTGSFAAGDPTAVTDANGAYTFAGLAAGTYSVGVEPLAGFTQTGAQGAFSSATVTGGQDTTVASFGEAPQTTGMITGNVYSDLNADGTQQSGEPGLQDWYVFIDLGNTGTYVGSDPVTTTDSNGNFVLNGVAPGTYRVRVFPMDGFTTTQGVNGYDATVVANEVTPGNFFGESQPSATLSGTVYNDANSNSVQDSGEVGLQGWQIYLDLRNTGLYATGDPLVITDANGTYTFSGLQPGKYTVRLLPVDPSYSTTQGASGWTANAVAGTTSNGGSFGETQVTGSLSGTVYSDINSDGALDAGEPGIQNWVVYIDQNNTGSYVSGDTYVYTNNYGGYSFTGLAPGKYTIRQIPVNGWTTTQGANGWSATVIGNQDSNGGPFGEHH